jgi:hypothetical protein
VPYLPRDIPRLHFRRLQALRLAQNASEAVTEDQEVPQEPRQCVAPVPGSCVLSSDDTRICSPPSEIVLPTTKDLTSVEDQYLSRTSNALDQLHDLNSNFDFILDTDYVPTEQDLLSSMAPQLTLQPAHSFPLQKEVLNSELSLFFSQAYVAYPVLHHPTIMKNFDEDWHISNREFSALMLSVVVLNEACKVRLSPQHDPSVLEFLVKTIESLRISLDHDGRHFAENPSMDTVVVSLCLFIAYNVFQRHSRAFFYLTEAIGLFDLVPDPCDTVERVRQKRLAYILYITESATVSIYGSHRKRMISRRPSNPLETVQSLTWYDQEAASQDDITDSTQDEIQHFDRQAVELLLLMTRLHLATNVAEVAKITVDDKLMWCLSNRLQGNHSTPLTLRYDTQMADVAITRQWKLAGHWWNEMSLRPTLMSSSGAIESTIEMIATTAITWSKTLPRGYLRIVGLGKLVDLIDSMFNISTTLGKLGDCTALMRHLMHTVAETDYDKYFAPQLSVMEICIGDIPQSLVSDDELARSSYNISVV